jgi:xanthine dehydrogenase accessory factor
MRALLREMLSLTQRRRPFAVCTVVQADGSVPGKLGSTMIVTEDGATRGTVGGAGLEERVKASALGALKTGKGSLQHYDLAKWKAQGLNSVCGGSVDVSILVHRPLPHLVLFGGGHCGKALADMGRLLDWDVTIVDVRAEYANRERFPEALDVHAIDPVAFAATAPLEDVSHVYLLGHSWEIDTSILAALLPRFDGFVGVIGSQAKRKAMFDELRRRGVPAERLSRVVCPIGVDIGSESPEEIAVAVAAEVIATTRRTGAVVHSSSVPEATSR